MQQVFENIGFIVNISMILVFLQYSSGERKKKTTGFTVTAVVTIQFVMMLIEQQLLTITDKNLLRFMWYNTFAMCDIALMLMLYHMHRQAKIPYGMAAKHTNLSFMCLGFLQVFCFLERSYTQSEIIKTIYSYAVPAINISIMFLLTGIMLKEMFSPQINAAKATNHTQ